MEKQIIKVMQEFKVGGNCCEGTEIWILLLKKILFFYFAGYFDPKRKSFYYIFSCSLYLLYFFTEKSILEDLIFLP